MIKIAENPAVKALLAESTKKVVAQEPKPAERFVRAPAGAGHEAALQQKGGSR